MTSGQRADPSVSFELSDSQAVADWAMPDDVSVTVSAEQTGGRLDIIAVLRNDADEPRQVNYLTGGVMGRATNPFNVTLPLELRQVPPETPAGPEVYPRPMQATLPAHTSIRFVRPFCLSAYEVESGQAVAVPWSFEVWDGPRTGTVNTTIR